LDSSGDREASLTIARRSDLNWLDFVGLLFLIGLAVLPPIAEWHKQLILLAIGVAQLAEGRIVRQLPRRGPWYVMLIKIGLATILVDHTGELAINSSYYPIYFLPIVTAALYFGPWGTLLWAVAASAAYCSYLYPALEQYTLSPSGVTELALRILFFFLMAMVVNRFTIETRRQTRRYQELAERLAETNRQLGQAQEEARRSERLAALGQLSAGLAHEIRNPLAVIKGSAETLSEKLQGADELSRELASYILSEGNRVAALVNDFLDFARPMRAEPQPAEITSLLDRVLDTVAERWQGGPVRVERQYAPNLPLVPLDESLCEQAFLNLAQNAFEALGDTGGVLTVEVRRAVSQERDGVEVRFSDNGPGVAREMRDQIFNPFVTTKKTGVGLGLSIVSRIVDGHQGAIRVEDSAAGGACFVLFFPIEVPAETQPTTPSLTRASK
jgi:signal transduction histidine kinase